MSGGEELLALGIILAALVLGLEGLCGLALLAESILRKLKREGRI